MRSYEKYVVFAGHYYYPSGGWHDYRASFSHLDDAKDYAKNLTDLEEYPHYDWSQVVDTEKDGLIRTYHIE